MMKKNFLFYYIPCEVRDSIEEKWKKQQKKFQTEANALMDKEFDPKMFQL